YPASITEFRKGLELYGGDPLTKGYLAFALGKSGERGEAQKLIEEIKNDTSGAYVSEYGLGVAYLCRGQKAEAFARFVKSAEAHDTAAAFYGVDPLLDDLRSDPRFPDLLRRVGLAP